MTRRIVIISENVSRKMGGEAIKAHQFVRYLCEKDRDPVVIAHGRCADEVAADFPDLEIQLVQDDWLQALCWRSFVLRPLLGPLFHWRAAQIIRGKIDPAQSILHYVNPISPVALRLPPKGWRTVIGPITGNIYYPPGFRHRMSRLNRVRERAHGLIQRVFGAILTDKKRAEALLISGYERTRVSLKWFGCDERKMVDVVDSGVNDRLKQAPRMRHETQNFRFMCIGRMIPLKSFDLAIRALALTDHRVTLDLIGDGEARAGWEALAHDLGLSDRVRFLGHVANDELAEIFPDYRAQIFPSMMDANGIVVQEAMMIGLPVIALRWGGPAGLADDESAVYIAPTGEDEVVRDIAAAMDRLSTDPAEAERISVNARAIAESRFSWDQVAESWLAAYPD